MNGRERSAQAFRRPFRRNFNAPGMARRRLSSVRRVGNNDFTQGLSGRLRNRQNLRMENDTAAINRPLYRSLSNASLSSRGRSRVPIRSQRSRSRSRSRSRPRLLNNRNALNNSNFNLNQPMMTIRTGRSRSRQRSVPPPKRFNTNDNNNNNNNVRARSRSRSRVFQRQQIRNGNFIGRNRYGNSLPYRRLPIKARLGIRSTDIAQRFNGRRYALKNDKGKMGGVNRGRIERRRRINNVSQRNAMQTSTGGRGRQSRSRDR